MFQFKIYSRELNDYTRAWVSKNSEFIIGKLTYSFAVALRKKSIIFNVLAVLTDWLHLKIYF